MPKKPKHIRPPQKTNPVQLQNKDHGKKLKKSTIEKNAQLLLRMPSYENELTENFNDNGNSLTSQSTMGSNTSLTGLFFLFLLTTNLPSILAATNEQNDSLTKGKSSEKKAIPRSRELEKSSLNLLDKMYYDLNEAIYRNNTAKTKTILENLTKKFHLTIKNINDPEKGTLLYRAIENNNIEIVKLLLEYDADINQKIANITPLAAAIIHQREEIALLLIELGADVNLKSQFSTEQTPLQSAIFKKQIKVVKAILQKHQNIQEIDYLPENKISPLLWAISQNEYEIALLLINLGANVNAESHDGTNALFYVEDNGAEIIDLLIKQGIDINKKNQEGSTPLMLAANKGKKIVVLKLIEHLADINIEMCQKQDAIFFAKNIEIKNILLVYKEIIDLLDQGISNEALNIMDKLPENEKKYFAPLYKLAQALTQPKIKEAKKIIGEVAKNFQQPGKEQYITSCLYIKNNNYKKALDSIKQAIEMDPKNQKYQIKKRAIEFNLDETNTVNNYQGQSLEDILSADHCDINFPLTELGYTLDFRHFNIGNIVSKNQAQVREAQYELAWQFHDQNQPEKTIEICKELIKVTPDQPHFRFVNAKLYFLLGKAEIKNNNFLQAIEYLKISYGLAYVETHPEIIEALSFAITQADESLFSINTILLLHNKYYQLHLKNEKFSPEGKSEYYFQKQYNLSFSLSKKIENNKDLNYLKKYPKQLTEAFVAAVDLANYAIENDLHYEFEYMLFLAKRISANFDLYPNVLASKNSITHIDTPDNNNYWYLIEDLVKKRKNHYAPRISLFYTYFLIYIKNQMKFSVENIILLGGIFVTAINYFVMPLLARKNVIRQPTQLEVPPQTLEQNKLERHIEDFPESENLNLTDKQDSIDLEQVKTIIETLGKDLLEEVTINENLLNMKLKNNFAAASMPILKNGEMDIALQHNPSLKNILINPEIYHIEINKFLKPYFMTIDQNNLLVCDDTKKLFKILKEEETYAKILRNAKNININIKTKIFLNDPNFILTNSSIKTYNRIDNVVKNLERIDNSFKLELNKSLERTNGLISQLKSTQDNFSDNIDIKIKNKVTDLIIETDELKNTILKIKTSNLELLIAENNPAITKELSRINDFKKTDFNKNFSQVIDAEDLNSWEKLPDKAKFELDKVQDELSSKIETLYAQSVSLNINQNPTSIKKRTNKKLQKSKFNKKGLAQVISNSPATFFHSNENQETKLKEEKKLDTNNNNVDPIIVEVIPPRNLNKNIEEKSIEKESLPNNAEILLKKAESLCKAIIKLQEIKPPIDASYEAALKRASLRYMVRLCQTISRAAMLINPKDVNVEISSIKKTRNIIKDIWQIFSYGTGKDIENIRLLQIHAKNLAKLLANDLIKQFLDKNQQTRGFILLAENKNFKNLMALLSQNYAEQEKIDFDTYLLRIKTEFDCIADFKKSIDSENYPSSLIASFAFIGSTLKKLKDFYPEALFEDGKRKPFKYSEDLLKHVQATVKHEVYLAFIKDIQDAKEMKKQEYLTKKHEELDIFPLLNLLEKIDPTASESIIKKLEMFEVFALLEEICDAMRHKVYSEEINDPQQLLQVTEKIILLSNLILKTLKDNYDNFHQAKEVKNSNDVSEETATSFGRKY